MDSDSFYMYDLKVLRRAYEEWTRLLPSVRPFYAVKCNPDERVCDLLATLGASFDCASPSEIELITRLGVEPGRIIYANPCKRPCDAERYAHLTTTFDCQSELTKLSAGTRVLLRIRADDPDARCNLGVKYGAVEHEWRPLIEACKFLKLNLVGVSFHVGSLAKSACAYTGAIAQARLAIDMATWYGFTPDIVDIGGGFSPRNLCELAGPINEALSLYFPQGYEFIAEPGRYFAEDVATLYTPVIGVKNDSVTISESLYGSFNCVLFDHATPEVGAVIGPNGQELRGVPTKRRIFGSTCDGADIISNDCRLIDVHIGDWLVWPRMGAYTSAATTSFNGIPFNERVRVYVT
jgi:ornithine decarboxylase